MIQVSISEVASQAVLDQAEYYLEHSGPQLAQRWEASVLRTARSLQHFPQRAAERIWISPRLKSVRALPIEDFENHLLFYRYDATNSAVTIIHILHGARDLESLLEENLL